MLEKTTRAGEMNRRGRSPGRGVPAFALLAWALLVMPAMTPADEIMPTIVDDVDDSDEEGGPPHFHSLEEMGGQSVRQEVPEMWLVKGQFKRPHLLEVQAIIVKDEQVTDDCKPSKTDLRKSNWRHFMCYGSILSQTFILTSTACLHETLYIRHNIQASLAAVIAPVSESIQVIKILQYIIHPKLDVDPRHTKDHIKHNLAIAKLACKISKKNLFPIELPSKPITEMCKGDKCYVTVIKRKEDHSSLIFEYMVRDLEYHRVSIRQANDEDNNDMKEATETRLMCTKSGSAVMDNNIQVGVVAMSCDVRQPQTRWLYTDLFDNVDWIASIAELERPMTQKEPSSDNAEDQKEKPTEKCSSCVYNFYFDWKQKDMCPNKMINDLTDSSSTCNSKSTEPQAEKNSSHMQIAAYPKDDYLRALDLMYRDQFKHNHQGVPIAPPTVDEQSIDDQMIPVTDDFEVNKKTDTSGNQKSNTDNESQPKEKTNDVSTRKNAAVPDEYKKLYEQYLQELQLQNG